MTNALLKQAQAAVKDGKVQDQTKGGGSFERTVAPAGPAWARLIAYYEVGSREQKAYQGKEKPPARIAYLEFQLFGKKHQREIVVDGETKTVYNTHRQRITLKGGDRSNSTKLLKAMAYGRDINHFALMLGEPFKITLHHNEVEKDGKTTTYVNMRDDSGWTIGAAVRDQVDEDTGDVEVVPVKVAEATYDMRLLMWDAPTKEQWDSLFIDGTFTRTVDGKEVEMSANWIQRACQEALDWEGSPVQALVATDNGDLPDMGTTDPSPGLPEDNDFDDDIPF